MAESSNVVSSSSPLMETPKAGYLLRFQLLDKLLSVMFNFLVNRSNDGSVYSFKFSSIILRGVLQYLTSARFSITNKIKPGTKAFMKSRLENFNRLASSLNSVTDLGLDEKDRFVLNRFSSLVIIEVILQRDLHDLVDLITEKEGRSENLMDRRMHFHKLDCYLHSLQRQLRKVHFGPYVSSNIFAALLIRTFINQCLHDNNLSIIDEDLFQYLTKRSLDFGMFISSSIQLEKSAMTEDQFMVLEKNPSVFILSSILHPNAGVILLQLLTMSEDEIEKLSPHYLDEILESFEESFEPFE